MSSRASHSYIPILKGKRGEFDALSWLDDELKGGVSPMIEVVPVPRDLEDDTPTKSIEAHLQTAVTQIARGWGDSAPVLLDTIWLDPDEMAGAVHHLEYLFDQARGSLTAVPVGGLTRGVRHAAAVGAVAATDGRGAVLRIDTEDIADIADLEPAIEAWLETVAVPAEEVDLILDFGELTATTYGPILLAARVLIASFPGLADWRSLTVASGAFPQFLMDISPDSEHVFDRLDWRLWRAIASADGPRVPAFADYVIAHPALLDADPRTLRPTASIRYTTDPAWLIIKRRWVRHGYEQFRTASGILVARTEYEGVDHCRGCEFVNACAAGGPTGSLTTWRAVGSCHHMTHTAEQLASLA